MYAVTGKRDLGFTSNHDTAKKRTSITDDFDVSHLSKKELWEHRGNEISITATDFKNGGNF